MKQNAEGFAKIIWRIYYYTDILKEMLMAMFLNLLVLLLCTVTITEAMVTREKLFYLFRGYRMTNCIFQTIMLSRSTGLQRQCAGHCVGDNNCEAFNVQLGLKSCQLLSKTLYQSNSIVEYTADWDFYYTKYGKNYSLLFMTVRCQIM